MKKSQIITSIIVVAVLLFGVALYYVNKSSQNAEQPIVAQPPASEQTSQTQTTVSTETITVPNFDKTDWKLYRDKDLGVEFQIPNNLTKYDNGQFRSSEKQTEHQQAVKNCASAKNPYGEIDPYNCVWWDRPNFELQFGVFDWNSDRGDPERTRVTINGVVWLKADIGNDYQSYQKQGKPVFNYQLESRPSPDKSFEFVSEDEQLLQKIISTFKRI